MDKNSLRQERMQVEKYLNDRDFDVTMTEECAYSENRLEGSAFSVELLLQIFNFANSASLCKLASVCSHWKTLSEDWTLWRSLCLKENLLKAPEVVNAIQPPTPFKSWKEAFQWHYESKFRVFQNNEIKNGRGSFVWPNGAKYEGEWLDDKEHGRGTKMWIDGATYEGEWLQGKFDGYGIHTWASGSRYEGMWTKHKRNGWGRNTWPQKDLYEGEWSDDQKNGFGVYSWADGRIYKGYWKADRRCGLGCFVWTPNGYKYEGEWMNDRGHGTGRFFWENGDYYEGPWMNGRRFGKGQFIKKDSGQRFIQDWREDREFSVFDKGDMSQVSAPAECDSSLGILEDFVNLKRKMQMEEAVELVNFIKSEPDRKKRCLRVR